MGARKLEKVNECGGGQENVIFVDQICRKKNKNCVDIFYRQFFIDGNTLLSNKI